MTAVPVANDKNSHKKSFARLCAVQALYQLRMSADSTPKKVVAEFIAHRLTGNEDHGDADEKHFTLLVEGVNEKAKEIDELIKGVLTKDWRIERLEHIMLSVLRAGVYEILNCPDIPVAVIVNEYVEVAKAFYDGSEPGFVNGILDNLAKTSRT